VNARHSQEHRRCAGNAPRHQQPTGDAQGMSVTTNDYHQREQHQQQEQQIRHADQHTRDRQERTRRGEGGFSNNVSNIDVRPARELQTTRLASDDLPALAGSSIYTDKLPAPTDSPRKIGKEERDAAQGRRPTAFSNHVSNTDARSARVIQTSRLASEALQTLKGSSDAPLRRSDPRSRRGRGNQGGPNAGNRPTTIGRKLLTSSEQGPAPRATVTGGRNPQRYRTPPTISTHAGVPEPAKGSGFPGEETTTMKQISSKHQPHGDDTTQTGVKLTSIGGKSAQLENFSTLISTPKAGDTSQGRTGVKLTSLGSKFAQLEKPSSLSLRPETPPRGRSRATTTHTAMIPP